MDELLKRYQNAQITEDDLLTAISARVEQLLEGDPGLLFSYLYRLDIDEGSLNEIISQSSADSVATRVAKLVLQRQKSRINTKKNLDQGPPIEGWEW